MSGRFVRASKYRHVFGRSTKKEQCYDNLRISKNAWDTNLVKANPTYISVNWESSGGGAFAVIPVNERGRLPERIPLFRGHTAAVLDTDWNPFDDSVVASASDDGKVFIWKVPEGFSLLSDADEPEDVSPVAKLSGHSRKVGHVLFNPAAEGVLASASGDYTIKIWDVETGKSRLSLKHGDIVQSLSWSGDGSRIVTTSRDKKLRIWDARQQRPAHEGAGHSGAKNSRCVWMGELERVATTGFSRMSDRQLGLWDVRAAREPINGFAFMDSISGVCMPFWDEGTHCLYLAGKGDGNIRYYEYENDKFESLSEYKSPEPQRGVAFMPKRGVNVHDNEVTRAFKTVNDTYIEPVSFIVPRRAEVFQEDIYPPCVGSKPAMSAAEWFDGKTAFPPKISLQSVYDGSETPTEVAASAVPSTSTSAPEPPPAHTPTPTSASAAAPKASEPAQPSPGAAAARSPPGSVGENKASMAAMASKYADSGSESDEEDDEADGFAEPSKPSAPVSSRTEEKPRDQEAKLDANMAPAAAAAAARSAAVPSSTGNAAAQVPSTATGGASAAGSGPGEGLRAHLTDIKSMLEAQTKALASQSEQIAKLVAEVETLKTQVMDQGRSEREKDERIRMLELELESARS